MLNRPAGASRRIFIDTSEFEGQNFNFEATVFKALEGLVDNGHITVVLTDVTVSEVKNRIRERVREAVETQSTFRGKAKILQAINSSDVKAAVKPLDADDISSTVISSFDDLVKRLRAETIGIDDVKPSNVFSQYFDRRPPFGVGKKKHEFPDAFILEALRQLALKDGNPINVVSRDGDMVAACADSEGLLVRQERFSGLVDEITSEADRSATNWVRKEVEVHRDLIVDEVTQKFEWLGFWLEDQDGDVGDVEVTYVDVDEPSIITLDGENAVVQIPASIDFGADVSYDDLETASYDSEDKRLFPWRTIEKRVQNSIAVTVEILFSYEVGDSDQFKINRLTIDNDSDIGIMAESWEY